MRESILGFPKIMGTFLGVPIIRTIVFWGLYWGPPILGNYHILGLCLSLAGWGCLVGEGITTGLVCQALSCTLRKTNMEPEGRPFKEDGNLYRACCQFPCQFSGEHMASSSVALCRKPA